MYAAHISGCRSSNCTFTVISKSNMQAERGAQIQMQCLRSDPCAWFCPHFRFWYTTVQPLHRHSLLYAACTQLRGGVKRSSQGFGSKERSQHQSEWALKVSVCFVCFSHICAIIQCEKCCLSASASCIKTSHCCWFFLSRVTDLLSDSSYNFPKAACIGWACWVPSKTPLLSEAMYVWQCHCYY